MSRSREIVEYCTGCGKADYELNGLVGIADKNVNICLHCTMAITRMFHVMNGREMIAADIGLPEEETKP